MKRVKVSIALLLVLMFCAAVITGCNQKKMVQAGEVSDFSEEKRFGAADLLTNLGASGEEGDPASDSGEASSNGEQQSSGPSQSAQEGTQTVKPTTSSGEITGEMVVNEKKYAFKEENLMLLNVENKTNKHVDLTIHGKYLDADGNVIKEESQSYTAFPSGWKNYFIFRPARAFESFEYTLEVKEYDAADKIHSTNGEPLSLYMDVTYEKKLYWWRGADINTQRDLFFDIELINRHPSVSISAECYVLILDEQGEIYTMDWEYFDNMPIPSICRSGTMADPVGGEKSGNATVALKTQPKGADETIPANVQGKFTAIFAYTDVVDYNEAMKALGY